MLFSGKWFDPVVGMDDARVAEEVDPDRERPRVRTRRNPDGGDGMHVDQMLHVVGRIVALQRAIDQRRNDLSRPAKEMREVVIAPQLHRRLECCIAVGHRAGGVVQVRLEQPADPDEQWILEFATHRNPLRQGCFAIVTVT